MSRTIPEQPNTALLRTRRRRGFERKQVSWLLGHKGPQALAGYERGRALPSLQNAIRLSIIYGCDLEEIFPEKYKAARADIFEQTTHKRVLAHHRFPELVRNINKCSYEDAFDDPQKAATYRADIRDHITRLAKALAQL